MAISGGCATTSPSTKPGEHAVGTQYGPSTSRAPAQELTQETIEIVKSHFGELEACYEASLAGDNSLAGIVELELTIAQDGIIERVYLWMARVQPNSIYAS